MTKQSIYSEAEYLYKYFFTGIRRTVRRMGWRLWLKELISEIEFKLRYPRFKSLYRIYPSDLDIPAEIRPYVNQFEATNYYRLSECFNKLERSLQDIDHSIFIDIGSGLGRVLLRAAQSGFSRIVGIEISARLCDLCTKNLNEYLLPNVRPEIINQDVQEIDFCEIVKRFGCNEGIRLIVFFLYNPFTDPVLRVFMDKLDELQAYDVCLVYAGKQYKEIVTNKGFRMIWEELTNHQFILDSFRIYYREKVPNLGFDQ